MSTSNPRFRPAKLAGIAIAAVAIGGAAMFLIPRVDPHEHGAAEQGGTVYVCPMHPWIKSGSPGRCTICGMNLVGRSPSAAAAVATAVSGIQLSASQVGTIGVETAEIVRGPLKKTLRVTGRIEDDDTSHRVIAARVAGRVERLHIRYVGEAVVANESVVTIYSPDVLTAQRSYLELLNANTAYARTELSAARERLLQLGLTEGDIAGFLEKKEPSPYVVIRAPASGTVVSKNAYEGRYVQPTDELYEIADFSKMWFNFDAFEQDMPWIQPGQRIDITSDSFAGEKFVEMIEFINPNFDMTTRTTKVRAVLHEPHIFTGDVHIYAYHGILAQGLVHLPSPEVILVPRSAVLDTGGGPVVYVDTGMNQYQQRRPLLGRRGDTHFEVISGLSVGERVVTRGALFVDAQAQLTREGGGQAATP